MRDFIGMERFANDQYAKRLDHFFHALGCEISPEMFAPRQKAAQERPRMQSSQPWATQTDVVWTVCLYRAGVIDLATARKLLLALDKIWDDPTGLTGKTVVC